MIDVDSRIWQLRELFDKVKAVAFGEVAPGALTVTFPDYLPPLVLTTAADECISRAASAIRKCSIAGDTFFVSAHYEDNRDSASCCVVLSVQLKRPEMQNCLSVVNAYLGEIEQIVMELQSKSVELSISTAESCLSLDFRIPVHFPGTQLTRHRNAILLVEDEAFVRNATREVLEIAGYNVLESTNAEEALRTFELHRQSLCAVISDVTMPGRDGRELAMILRAAMPRLPILLISGYSSPVTEDLSKHIYYLPKPYNSEALLAAVRRCLQVHHQATESLFVRGPVPDERVTELC